jgi:hypothetical protein
MAAKELTLKFNREKETKNTMRFQADGHEVTPYIYISKEADAKLGKPDTITVTIKGG